MSKWNEVHNDWRLALNKYLGFPTFIQLENERDVMEDCMSLLGIDFDHSGYVNWRDGFKFVDDESRDKIQSLIGWKEQTYKLSSDELSKVLKSMEDLSRIADDLYHGTTDELPSQFMSVLEKISPMCDSVKKLIYDESL